MKLLGKVIFCFTLSINTASYALAQKTQIPPDLLAVDQQRCMQECVPGFGEITCKPLCDCTVAEFQKRLNFDVYLELSRQLSRSEVDDANRQRLDEIANYCASQIEKSGIEIGGDLKKPEAPTPNK